MKSISRKEARERVAQAKVDLLNPEERAQTLDEWWPLDFEDEGWSELPDSLREELGTRDDAPSDATPSKYDPLLQVAAMRETHGVCNSWLQRMLSKFFKADGQVEIIGEPEEMLKCLCCGYLTIQQRGGYEICPVCFWEDDGSQELDQTSGPNHMTLREARENFVRVGACSVDAVQHVEAEAREMYPRGTGRAGDMECAD